MFMLRIFWALMATCHCMEFGDRAAKFSIELMYFTAEETNWHTVISPLSVWSMLTGLYMATTGLGKNELRHALYLPNKRDPYVYKMHKDFMANMTWQTYEKVRLVNKNFILVDEKLNIVPEYQKFSAKEFNSEVIKLRYNSSFTAADVANTIIKESDLTVHSVLRSEDFHSQENFTMILTNVISFNGLWQTPFQTARTREEFFYDEGGKLIGKVNMMQQDGFFKLSNLPKISAKVLELPYGNDGDFSFLVVLPYSSAKVREVYKVFEWATVKNILEKLEQDAKDYGKMNVSLSLPRFQISSNVALNKPLLNMNIVQIFNPDSDTFKLISTDRLHVSTIVHKAEIKVTETELDASAVASIETRFSSNLDKFKVNRPFLYFIIRRSTATVIFSGVYSKPTVF